MCRWSVGLRQDPMNHRAFRHALLVLAAVAAGVAVLFVTGVVPGKPVFQPILHMIIVSFMSYAALVGAMVASRSARKRNDVRTALVASGFTVMTGLLALH